MLDKINPATHRYISKYFKAMPAKELQALADSIVAFSEALNNHDPAAEQALMAWIEESPGYSGKMLMGEY